MCTRSFYEQKATVGMPGRPLWPVGGYGGQNVLRDPRNRSISVAAFRPPSGDPVTGCFGHAPHTKLDLGRTNAHVRAKRPQHKWHWHRRGPVPGVALSHQNCRRTSSSRPRAAAAAAAAPPGSCTARWWACMAWIVRIQVP